MKKKYVFAIGVVLAFFVYAAVVLQYKKFAAEWFGINILLIAGLAAGITTLVLSRLYWFRCGGETDYKMFAIPLVGLLVCIVLGLHFTEQRTETMRSSDYQYNYALTRTGYFYNNIVSNGNGSSADSDVDIDLDDADGEAVAYLFLIILVVVLIVGSALIPHFWVFSGAVLLAVLGILAFREFLLE